MTVDEIESSEWYRPNQLALVDEYAKLFSNRRTIYAHIKADRIPYLRPYGCKHILVKGEDFINFLADYVMTEAEKT
jgi:hypothetical protein